MARNSTKFDAIAKQYLYGQNSIMALTLKFKSIVLALLLLSGCGGDAQNAGDAAPDEPADPKPDTGSSIPTFAQPKKINTDNTGDVVESRLLVDGRSSATTTVIWRQYDGMRHNLFSSKYAEGNGFWSPQPVLLETSEGDVRDIDMVVDDNGSVTVVWTQNMGNHYGLWANFYDWNTSRWREPVLIEGSSTGDVGSILLTVDSSRRVTVVWTQADAAAEQQLWINHFHPNEGVAGSWRGASQVSDNANGSVKSMTLATESWGAMMLLWTQVNAAGSYVDLWARRKTPPAGGTAWSSSPAQRLDIEDKGDAMLPAVVVDFNGNYTAVWGQYDGSRQDLWTARYNNADWSTAAKIETQDLDSVDAPWLFIDAANVITALWLQNDGLVNQLWTRRSVAGVWGTAQPLANGVGSISGFKAVAEVNGKLVATWLQNNGTTEDLWANYFDGNTWGTAQLIEANNTNSATLPLLFLDKNGNATAIWSQKEVNSIDLWASRYNVGSGWAVADKLEAWAGDVITAPSGIMDSAGKITALWRQRHESANHLLMTQYNFASGRWNDVNKVAEKQAVGGYAPQLTIDNTDDVTLIWLQPTNERVELWGNRL